jgi:hypothetical protein
VARLGSTIEAALSTRRMAVLGHRPMTRQKIVAQFHDYGAAHRAFCELIQTGIQPNEISIIAGDRSNGHGAKRDFGILEEDAETYIAAVRRGTTLLAVQIDDPGHARVAEIIEHQGPIDLAEFGSHRRRRRW